MTRILITNDDGIHSDGLVKLEEALKELATSMSWRRPLK